MLLAMVKALKGEKVLDELFIELTEFYNTPSGFFKVRIKGLFYFGLKCIIKAENRTGVGAL